MNHPDVENWNKVIDKERIIGENNLQEMQTYANSFHAVGMDMKEITWEVSTFGIGFLTAESSEQKMN